VNQLDQCPVKGKFGKYGGKFVPETLMPALTELEESYARFNGDEAARHEFDHYLKNSLVDQLLSTMLRT